VIRVTRGSVRLYGADFRRSGPGIVYHSLGVNGANVTLLSRSFSGPHWTAELRHYKPDLVIINYGTNESGYPSFVEGTWAQELKGAVKRVQAALPDTSVLLMSPWIAASANTTAPSTPSPPCPAWSRSKPASGRKRAWLFSIPFKPWADLEPWADGMRRSLAWWEPTSSIRCPLALR